MAEHYRALIFVLVLGLPAIYVTQLALRDVVAESELKIWRNAWVVATLAFFLSGHVLVYTAVMIALAAYVHRISTAPIYLYFVLLLTGPAIGVNLGIPGIIGYLIELSPSRVVSVAFLLPAAISIWRSSRIRYSRTDKLVACFLILVVALSLRLGSPTHMLRVTAVVLVDIALPYFVFSRSVTTSQSIRTAFAAVLFATVPFAMAGMFEFARGWRLYEAAISQWGVSLIQVYLFRDGLLRAATTAIEPIAFGFACMVAVGCALALWDKVERRMALIAACAIVVGGLAASLSRGPWLGTAFLFTVFVATRREGLQMTAKASAAFVLLCVPLFMSPYGDPIIRLLPFVGDVDDSTEDYRSNLIDAAIAVVSRNPLFGSVNFREEPEMLAMVQGQGIIDVVNTYAAVALEYGLVGLLIFLAIFASVGPGLLRLSFQSGGEKPVLARALIAIIAAIMLTIVTVSSVSVIPYIYWAFLGLCAALLSIRQEDTPKAVADAKPKLTVLGR